MNDILPALNKLPFFTIEGFKQLVEEQAVEVEYAPVTLYRWMKAGKIIQIKKGVYLTRWFYETYRGEADFAPTISAIIRPQSYVSLAYVLQRHGILTEVTYSVTAVSMKSPRTIENSLGTFSYRYIKPGLYTGYQVHDFHSIPFASASLAKALFDYLYFYPLSQTIKRQDYDLVEDLRLNLDDFTQEEQEEFAGYVSLSRMAKMERILEVLRRTTWRP